MRALEADCYDRNRCCGCTPLDRVGGVLLAGACWGALSGGRDGVESQVDLQKYGKMEADFLEGFEDGAFFRSTCRSHMRSHICRMPGQLKGLFVAKSHKMHIAPFSKAIRGTAAVTTAINYSDEAFDTSCISRPCIWLELYMI